MSLQSRLSTSELRVRSQQARCDSRINNEAARSSPYRYENNTRLLGIVPVSLLLNRYLQQQKIGGTQARGTDGAVSVLSPDPFCRPQRYAYNA